MINTNNYSSAQDLTSNLTLNKIKKLIEPFKNIKILIGITCKPEFYDYIIKEFEEVKSKSLARDFYGVDIYKISNQEENVKYWYNNQKEELNKYLKNNV